MRLRAPLAREHSTDPAGPIQPSPAPPSPGPSRAAGHPGCDPPGHRLLETRDSYEIVVVTLPERKLD